MFVGCLYAYDRGHKELPTCVTTFNAGTAHAYDTGHTVATFSENAFQKTKTKTQMRCVAYVCAAGRGKRGLGGCSTFSLSAALQCQGLQFKTKKKTMVVLFCIKECGEHRNRNIVCGQHLTEASSVRCKPQLKSQ